MEHDPRRWGDRLAELVGAVALGAGTAASGWLVAPLQAANPAMLAGLAGVSGMMTGWLFVRFRASDAPSAILAPFDIAPIEALDEEGLAFDELLLVRQHVEPYRDPRVVELFDPQRRATPSDLQARIASHFGDPLRASSASLSPTPWNGSPASSDATDALHAALAEIRRSLRAS